jgi:hypothetical protein
MIPSSHRYEFSIAYVPKVVLCIGYTVPDEDSICQLKLG